MRLFILLLMSLFAPGQILAASPALEIFDAHIHYSSDVWVKLPPQRALELLTEAIRKDPGNTRVAIDHLFAVMESGVLEKILFCPRFFSEPLVRYQH